MMYTFFKELHIVFIYFSRKYVLFLNVRPFTFFHPVFCLVNYFVLISSPFFPCMTRKHTFNCIWCTDDTPQCTSLCSTYVRVVWLQTSGILFPYFNTHTHTHTDCHLYPISDLFSCYWKRKTNIYIYQSHGAIISQFVLLYMWANFMYQTDLHPESIVAQSRQRGREGGGRTEDIKKEIKMMQRREARLPILV